MEDMGRGGPDLLKRVEKLPKNGKAATSTVLLLGCIHREENRECAMGERGPASIELSNETGVCSNRITKKGTYGTDPSNAKFREGELRGGKK